MCAGEPLFSLTPVCHFLCTPLPPFTLPHHRMQLPVPVWLLQRFLHHHQEWRRTSPCPSATSRRYGRQPPAMELDLDCVQHACCENDWNKTEAYGVFASSWVKHRWMFFSLWFGSTNEQNLNFLGDLHVVGQIWKWRTSECLYAFAAHCSAVWAHHEFGI